MASTNEPELARGSATERLSRVGEKLVQQIVEVGIKGAGPIAGAEEVAEQALAAAGGDREAAIERLIASHVRRAGATGFVTGLGGAVTLPVTVPVSLGGLYVIATRMSAAIAYLRGHDIDTDEVQSAVLVCLLGSAGATALSRAGVDIGTKTTAAAIKKVPGRVLIEINKKVGYRLVTKAGQKGVINLTKFIPVVGGAVGATTDAISCKAIAAYAKSTFEPTSVVVVNGEAEILDAEVVSVIYDDQT